MSSSTETLRDWLFRGLTAEQALDSMEASGLAVRAATDIRALQRVLSLEDFSAPIRRASMDALPAYLAFFCLEHAVREFVSDRLSENHGASWWTSRVAGPIKDKVAKRRAAEDRNRWHVQRGAADIYYTDFGDLASIVQSNWGDFLDAFPDQNWILSRLGELENSRNVIAHMNVLDDREMTRIRLYLQDWTRQVG